ncbi:MAG: universal stress protein [Pyrinomonadaceae bacterium]|nr:universal stress protein [Pyrinomonadaceae bacterium]
MAHVSHKLSNSFEGALAGGGDPATSPLYVFGPFLKLIVLAGVAQITFGATVWLAVFTVIMVSAMYRQVMIWVTDGSGGSGLCEEEFGGWAVKINAAITFVEYTLTFLVSMAALVTFIADRFPALGGTIFGFQYRVLIAVALSILTGWIVNRGPKVAARAFGPATAAILLLLWIMILASIWRFGFNLPSIDFQAFSPQYLSLTLGGYARILALMTGIEIFANLVAAYGGTRAEKSRKSFNSLLIIMGTTSLTMLIVGPAIFQLSDVNNAEVSVFTQTMDALLPAWASYLGTLTGIAVLLSACAASAQGLQNLALGLRHRHYISAHFGQQNRFDVADKPVWLEVALVVVCFILFGTKEETYLALYAAGVFVLLSLTGWAASKRLFRELREKFTSVRMFSLVGTIVAALLTTGATFIIFGERFYEGAWTYLIFIPVLYAAFSFYRKRLGAPTSVEDRLGIIVARQRQLLDYTDDQANQTENLPENLSANAGAARLEKFLIPLDGSMLAEQSLPISRKLAVDFGANLILATIKNSKKKNAADAPSIDFNCDDYLQKTVAQIKVDTVPANCITAQGKDEATEINRLAIENAADLIVISTRGKFDVGQLFSASVAQRLIEQMSVPVLLLRPTDDWKSRYSEFKKIIVALDGSAESENVLPMVKTLADKFDGEVLFVSVPEGAESENYQETMQQYLDNIAAKLESPITRTRVLLGGSGPARTILTVAEEERADLIVLATHGRGGAGRIENLPLGSVATRVVEKTICPVLLIPVRQSGADV